MALAALLLVGVFLLGCGSDDDSDGGASGTDGSLPPNVVTQEEIDAQEDGTPERALLEWWQSYQFQDAPAVIELTSQETLDEVGEEELSDVVEAQGQSLQGIEILGSTEDGETATIRAGLLTFQPEKEGEPPPDEPTSSTPATFAMQDEDGEWLFADTDFLAPRVEAFVEAQQQAEEQPEEEQQDGGKGE